MARLLSACVSIVSALLLLSSPASAEDDGETTLKVQTPNGVIEGSQTRDLLEFKGIAYAQPPVGPLRWQPPQPPALWHGVKQARQFGAACMQKVAAQEPEKSLKDGPQSEDCLTLNIWEPAEAKTARMPLPVIVWVHGGSFRFGAGSLKTYDGAEFARRGVIFITLNYRLGLFGTFAQKELLQGKNPTGNFGLLDVMAALKWVRGNIRAFGGDPANVTLMGESAGGATVGYLMASPLAHGLFSKAIIESGALALPELSPEKAGEITERVSKELNAPDLKALSALPAEAIRDANTGVGDTQPFIDGKILPFKMREAFEKARVNRMPLIIGYNSAEAGFFGPRFWSGFPAEAGEKWPGLKAKCFGYGAENEDRCAEQVVSELFAGVNTRAVAQAAAPKMPVYAYRFDYVPAAQRSALPGAIHAAEIPYVFGRIAVEKQADPESSRMSAAMIDRWVAFAKTGYPQLLEGDWPALTHSQGKLMLFGNDGIHMGSNPANALLDAIDAAKLPPHP
ncbi:carboxylesterase/lipase family protein [Rhizobium paknamense]|uniref:Carboxylic ester hydrolase n=1 Tax=Rhizobium paknamense TaxID=1206817 RepID=A0ABU0II67_9HYPH|nr:carboxylesterase family protein [Rhizobium paknamense]MDQ0457313.1 para-nitrobenzyl esterase [Rhizobium paknamense]